MKFIVAICVAMLALTACGGGSSKPKSLTTAASPSSATPTSAPPASATSSAAAAAWSQAVAQQNYLAYVAPNNTDVGSLQSLLDAHSQDGSKYRAACKKVAADDDTLARQMSAGLWPTSAQTAVSAFVTAITENRTAFQACANATTNTAINDAITSPTFEAATSAAASAAEAVRIALGLPGN